LHRLTCIEVIPMSQKIKNFGRFTILERAVGVKIKRISQSNISVIWYFMWYWNKSQVNATVAISLGVIWQED